MASYHWVDEDRMCFQWWLVPPALGCLVLGAGLLVLLLGSGDALAYVHGGLFTLFGALLVWARVGRAIDRGQGVVTEWWGVLAFVRHREMPLGVFDAVVVAPEERRGRRGSPEFAVYLTGADGRAVGLLRRRDRYRASQAGRQVAEFTGLTLIDRSQEAGSDVVEGEPAGQSGM
ncbi:MAG: hypothetical protein ACLF0G_10200 [Candidatus Brocadiia bacterium]